MYNLTGELTLYSKKDGKTFIHVFDQGFNHNTFNFVKTTISTSADKIVFPESGTEFTIVHKTSGATLYIKKDNTVSTADFPLLENDPLILRGKPTFEIYGISGSGSIDVFVFTTVKE
jgi:hypothetical protein